MDSPRFDNLARSFGTRVNRRHLGRIAGGGALIGLVPLAHDRQGIKARKRRARAEHNIRGNKAIMCFEGETIRVPRKKRRKWLRSGATRGKCDNACTPVCPAGSCNLDDGCGGTCPGCGAGTICVESACQECTVTCESTPDNCGENLNVALLAGGDIYICPGTYRGMFAPGVDANLYGAGSGSDDAVDTILTSNGLGQTIVVTGEGQFLFSGLRIADGAGPSPYGGNVFISWPTADITFANCVVTNGNADYGAAFFIDGGTLTIQDCEIVGNMATSDGAALFTTETTGVPSVTITNSQITGNSASGSGGAIYAEVGTTTLSGSTITGNTSGNNGGGLYCANGTINLAADVEITQNTATTGTGGGIYRQAGTVYVNGANVTENDPDDCVGVAC